MKSGRIDPHLAEHRLGGQFHQLLGFPHQIAPATSFRQEPEHLQPQAHLGQVGAAQLPAGQNHTSSAGRTSGVIRQYQPSPQGTRTLP